MVLHHLYWVFVEQASRLFLLDQKIFYQQAGRLFHYQQAGRLFHYQQAGRLFHDLLSHFTGNSDTNYLSPAPFPLLYICINFKVKWSYLR
jgi:hypothetical protein